MLKGTAALFAGATLAACSAQAPTGTSAAASSGLQCVDMPAEGGLYTVSNGQFVPTVVKAEIVERVVQAPVGWPRRAGTMSAAAGSDAGGGGPRQVRGVRVERAGAACGGDLQGVEWRADW